MLCILHALPFFRDNNHSKVSIGFQRRVISNCTQCFLPLIDIGIQKSCFPTIAKNLCCYFCQMGFIRSIAICSPCHLQSWCGRTFHCFLNNFSHGFFRNHFLHWQLFILESSEVFICECNRFIKIQISYQYYSHIVRNIISIKIFIDRYHGRVLQVFRCSYSCLLTVWMFWKQSIHQFVVYKSSVIILCTVIFFVNSFQFSME